MKISVLTNEKGKIVGTLRMKNGSPGAPKQIGMLAGPGQRVHELDVPESIAKEALTKLHSRSVRIHGDRAELAD